MKHKLSILIAGVCLLFGLSLAACGGDGSADCKHEDATFTTTATCTEAGSTTWTCPDCNKTWTEPARALGHEYEKLEAQSVAASCTAPGKAVEKCTRCDDVKTEELPRLNHQYETVANLTKAATCTTPGVTVEVCKLCSDRKETYTPAKDHTWEGFDCTGKHCTACNETIPATASHDYKAGTPTAATCDTDGSTVYTCSVCSDTYTVTTPRTGHHYVITAESNQFTQKEGCTYLTSHTLKCDKCQAEKTEEYEVVRHNYISKITREATCAEDGEKQIVCADCGDVKEGSAQSIARNENAHSWEKNGAVAGNVQSYTCRTCHQTKTAIVAAEAEAKAVEVTKDALTGADEVVLNGASIAMDETAKNSLPADKNLTLALEVAAKPEYDASLGEKLDGKEIYDITLNDGSQNITNFGDGKITIRLPYVLKADEDVDAIVIWYVNGDKLEPMKATYSNGFVTFTTEHFSYYTVGKYTAEEMCAAYGHILVNRHKEPTCFESGYDFEICTRCNTIQTPAEERILPVKAHKWKEVTTPATCTEAGETVKTCEYCATELKTALPALGHTWALTDKGTAATCTAVGRQVYRCGTCEEEYTVTLPQLQHKFSAVVTEPTCTEGGYTTYTCTNAGCGYSYQGAKVAALGHRWNLDAPTCGEGQVCTVCGEKGLSATGKHSFGTDGVCTVCGQGCEHTFVEQETVPSTCRVPGYKLFVCSQCKAEKREYLPLGGHTYQNGTCTVCGARDEAANSFYENFLSSMVSDGYSFRSEDFGYTYTSEFSTNRGDCELLELRVQVTEDGTVLYVVHSIINETITAKGEAPMTRKQESYTLYDGTYVYRKSVVGDRVSYWKETGGSGGLPAGIESALQVLNQESVQNYLSNLMSVNSGEISKLVLAGADRFLNRTAKGSGYELTVDMAELAAIIKDMQTLSVAKFIDKQFGDGSFEALTDFLDEAIFELPVPSAVAELFARLNRYGIEQDSFFALVEDLVKVMGGEEISINEMLSQFSGSTVAEMIEEGQRMEAGSFREQYDAVLEMLTDDGYSVYDVLDALLPLRGITFSEAYGTAFDALLENGVTTLTFTTDSDGFIQSLAIGVDGFLMELPVVEPGAQPEVVEATGTGTVLWSAGGGFAPGSEFDVLTQPFALLREKIAANGGTLTIEGDDLNGRYDGGTPRHIEQVWTVADGKLSVSGSAKTTYVYGRSELPNGGYIEQGEEWTITFNLYDVENMSLWVGNDCGNWRCFQVDPDVDWYPSTRLFFEREYNAEGELVESRTESEEYSERDYLEIEVYFDLAAKKVAAASQHKVVVDTNRSTTAEDVGCEEKYYTYYVCEACGKDVSVQTYWKEHEWEETLQLDEGATSCEQGVTVLRECTLCGATEKAGHYTGHYQRSSYEEVQTPHGTLRIEMYACACGEQVSYYFNSSGDGCRFEHTGSETLENGHSLERRNCVVSGCTAYMTVESWGVGDPSACTREEHTVYRLYESEGVPMGREEGYTIDRVWTDHTMGEASETHQELNGNGYTGYRDEAVYSSCKHGYRIVNEWHYDEYGRAIYNLSETYMGGKLVSGSEGTTVYHGCEYTSTYKDLVTGESSEDSGIRHSMRELSHTEATCTQYGIAQSSCEICGETEYRVYDYPYGHYFEGGVCTRCGLRSQQGNSGEVVFEDLTDYAAASEYVVGVYHRSDPKVYEDHFLLVYLNGEEEVTEEVTLETQRRYSFDPSLFADWNSLNEYGKWLSEQSYMLVIDMEQVQGLINADKGTFVGLRVTYLPVDGSDWEVISITLTDDTKDFREALQEKIAEGGGKYVIESNDSYEYFFTLGENGGLVYHEGYTKKQYVTSEFQGDIEYSTYEVYYQETAYTLPSRFILLNASEAEGWLRVWVQGDAVVTEKMTTQIEHYEGDETFVEGGEEWETTGTSGTWLDATIYFNPATKTFARYL